MQSILDGFYKWEEEAFDVSSSHSSCLKVIPTVMLCCCNTTRWSCIYLSQLGTMVSDLCIQYLLSRKEFVSMEGAVRAGMKETLSPGESLRILKIRLVKLRGRSIGK